MHLFTRKNSSLHKGLTLHPFNHVPTSLCRQPHGPPTPHHFNTTDQVPTLGWTLCCLSTWEPTDSAKRSIWRPRAGNMAIIQISNPTLHRTRETEAELGVCGSHLRSTCPGRQKGKILEALGALIFGRNIGIGLDTPGRPYHPRSRDRRSRVDVYPSLSVHLHRSVELAVPPHPEVGREFAMQRVFKSYFSQGMG